mmetsp:Transcript_58129/g.180590  ORF Transcript_58129/g.180590 Transcript_58129/m.180590 type:complete len:251 (+) Transcript_58129:55-807(+)
MPSQSHCNTQKGEACTITELMISCQTNGAPPEQGMPARHPAYCTSKRKPSANMGAGAGAGAGAGKGHMQTSRHTQPQTGGCMHSRTRASGPNAAPVPVRKQGILLSGKKGLHVHWASCVMPIQKSSPAGTTIAQQSNNYLPSRRMRVMMVMVMARTKQKQTNQTNKQKRKSTHTSCKKPSARTYKTSSAAFNPCLNVANEEAVDRTWALSSCSALSLARLSLTMNRGNSSMADSILGSSLSNSLACSRKR